MSLSLREQQSLLQRIEAATRSGRDRIAAVDVDLKPEARRSRIQAVRDEVLKAVAATMTEMSARAQEAGKAVEGWSQAAARRRAKFADDPTEDATRRLAYFQTLSRTPTGGLVEHLKDAIESKSLAHAEAVRLEYHSRSDAAKAGEAFDRLFSTVVDPNAQAIEAECGSIIGLADLAQVLLREFSQGLSLPADRITAARAAGMIRQAEIADPAARAAALVARAKEKA